MIFVFLKTIPSNVRLSLTVFEVFMFFWFGRVGGVSVFELCEMFVALGMRWRGDDVFSSWFTESPQNMAQRARQGNDIFSTEPVEDKRSAVVRKIPGTYGI